MTRNSNNKDQGPSREHTKKELENNRLADENRTDKEEKMEIKNAHATGMGALGRSEQDQLGKWNYKSWEHDDDEVY